MIDDKIFDAEFLRSEMGLDTDTIIELKNIYIESIETMSINLNALIHDKTHTVDDIYGVVHALKGTASSVNDIYLTKQAANICDYIKYANQIFEADLITKCNDLNTLIGERLGQLRNLTLL